MRLRHDHAVLVIHTKNNGEYYESGSKNKDELDDQCRSSTGSSGALKSYLLSPPQQTKSCLPSFG